MFFSHFPELGRVLVAFPGQHPKLEKIFRVAFQKFAGSGNFVLQERGSDPQIDYVNLVLGNTQTFSEFFGGRDFFVQTQLMISKHGDVCIRHLPGMAFGPGAK